MCSRCRVGSVGSNEFLVHRAKSARVFVSTRICRVDRIDIYAHTCLFLILPLDPAHLTTSQTHLQDRHTFVNK